ncbi:MAG: hypothetical protein HUJ93_03705 [Bacteroidales bacterium]|nr:hypothetical protein [Bacteroidales bacterium]
MKDIILIVFLMTLFYMAIANRMRGYVKILAVQGCLLFVTAFLQLKEVTAFNLVWILVETVLFKSVAVPFFLYYIINRNRITRESEPYLPHFMSLIITSLIIAATFLTAEMVNDSYLDKMFFVTAMSSIFFGLYFIASRRKLLSHVMGYVVIENGVTILAFAVANEMPMLVNLGVLLDIFASVLILGIFINKIGDVFHDTDVEQLTELKD